MLRTDHGNTYPDANERLLTAAGAYGGRGYGYDAVSNRTGESFSIGNEAGTTAYAYPASTNRLASITGDETRAFTYDAAGNLLTDTAANDDDREDYDGNRGYRGHGHKYGHSKQSNKPKDTESRAFAYDSRNRNVAVTVRDGHGRDAKTFRYAYNAMGQRVAKDGVHFIYDLAGNLIAEKGNGGWKDYIYVGSMPVAMIENNQVYYIHTDHLGQPQKVTDTRQKIVWDRVAEPFGETMHILGPVNDNRGRNAQPTRGSATVPLNLRFPGQYHDEETGLDYNYFRTYDATVGRYTQSAPIGLAGGFNTYGYVGQNPVNWIDPYGLYGWWDFQRDAADAEIATLEAWTGLTDTLTWGTSKTYREQNGGEYVDTCSTAYSIGSYTGVGVDLVAGGGGLIKVGRLLPTTSKLYRPKGVPKDWVKTSARKDKPGSAKWVDPKNPHNYVRRRPDGSLTQVKDGKAIDKSGNAVEQNTPDAHFGPDDFIFRP